jgi:hypothetical protein
MMPFLNNRQNKNEQNILNKEELETALFFSDSISGFEHHF